MKEILQNMFDELQKDMKAECKITGMPSGLVGIDFYTRGFFSGNLYVFAGPPRSLKTALLLNIGWFMGCDFNYFVRYFSLNATPESLTRRMMFSACNIAINNYPYVSIKYQAMQMLYAAGEKLKNSNFRFICNSILTIDDIENECIHKKWKGVVIVDNYQMLTYGKKQHIVFRKLKYIALQYNIAILLIYETNYDLKINKEFFLRNGVDSIFLMRKEKTLGMEQDNEETGTIIFEILKQKNGPSGLFELFFDKNSFKIYDDEEDLFASSHSFADEHTPTC